MKKSLAQDDERHRQVIEYCGLEEKDHRNGCDAEDKHNNMFEIKTGTRNSITTATDLSLNILNQYKREYWIIGVGKIEIGAKKTYTLKELLWVHPKSMSLYFDKWEAQLMLRQEILREELSNRQHDYPAYKMKELERMLKHGSSLTDPHMNMSHIRKWGVPLPIDNSNLAQEMLHKLVEKNPLEEVNVVLCGRLDFLDD